MCPFHYITLFSVHQIWEGGTAVDEVDVPVTQPGDLWILGRHRLVCGDSSIENILNIALEKDRIDMLLTDPPYNVDYSGGGNGKREKLLNDNMKSDAYADLMERVFRNISTKMKPGAAFYVWHADKERESIEKALKMAQLPVKQSLIWKKNHFVLGRQDYQWIHEPCLYGWKEGAAHYFTQDRTQSTVVCESTDFSKMTKQELLEKCNELQHVIHQFSSVIDVDKPIISSEHPTMKPVELFGKFIANSARIGEIVFDAFAGSGTTIIAAEQLGRKACCIELSQTYCDVIVKRYKQFTRNDDVKLIRNGKEIMNFEIA